MINKDDKAADRSGVSPQSSERDPSREADAAWEPLGWRKVGHLWVQIAPRWAKPTTEPTRPAKAKAEAPDA